MGANGAGAVGLDRSGRSGSGRRGQSLPEATHRQSAAFLHYSRLFAESPKDVVQRRVDTSASQLCHLLSIRYALKQAGRAVA
jgi:hypothetical protein